MNIIINGEAVDFNGHTVADLLAFRQPERPFAVALKRQFVPKQDYAATVLQAGDAVEIVRPVAGG